MSKFTRILFGLALIAAGFWAWRAFFPNPERAVRNQVAALAKAASFSGGDGNFAKLAYVQRLGNFFAPEVEIEVELSAGQTVRVSGRDEILERAGALRLGVAWAKVQFLDVSVSVAPDHLSAVADVAAKASVPEDKDMMVQELKFTFKKLDGKWLIVRVEAVKTLSENFPAVQLTRAL
jgi:hypothetical protein